MGGVYVKVDGVILVGFGLQPTLTIIHKLTTRVRGCIVAHSASLSTVSEKAGPLVRPGVAELRVVLNQDLSSAHLLQGAKTQPAEVLSIYYCQTVLSKNKTIKT